LATLAAAQQIYQVIHTYTKFGTIEITRLSLPLFQSIVSGSVGLGTYNAGSGAYEEIIQALKAYADSFIAVVAQYTPPNGGMSEQFDKASGEPLSAADLTWSYASALTAFGARDGTLVPASWGAKDLNLPSVCKPGPPGKMVEVGFLVRAETQYGGEFS
jgi:glucoamylase